MSIKNIKLGLCCINTTLHKEGISTNRTCRLETAIKKGVDYIQTLVLQNLEDVIKILEWNENNSIKVYRLSSDIFPHLSNPNFGSNADNEPRYSIDFARDLLRKIGEKAKKYNQRLSFHPGQYNQIGTPHEKVFKNTVLDLKCHALILDAIEDGIDFGKHKGIICIHGGGVYNDKQKTISRWIKNFNTLPDNVKDRIAIENCEKCYTSEDCLNISYQTGIPHIFDIHHYHCYNILHPEEKQKPIEQLIPDILFMWYFCEKEPYFHISEQGNGRIGHHSDYINSIPEYLFKIDDTITLDIEAKAKEKAILHLVKIYGDK